MVVLGGDGGGGGAQEVAGTLDGRRAECITPHRKFKAIPQESREFLTSLFTSRARARARDGSCLHADRPSFGCCVSECVLRAPKRCCRRGARGDRLTFRGGRDPRARLPSGVSSSSNTWYYVGIFSPRRFLNKIHTSSEMRTALPVCLLCYHVWRHYLPYLHPLAPSRLQSALCVCDATAEIKASLVGRMMVPY